MYVGCHNRCGIVGWPVSCGVFSSQSESLTNFDCPEIRCNKNQKDISVAVMSFSNADVFDAAGLVYSSGFQLVLLQVQDSTFGHQVAVRHSIKNSIIKVFYY